MKPVPIPMKQWLAANERTRVLPGDQWYLNFSASILSLVKQSPLFKGGKTKRINMWLA